MNTIPQTPKSHDRFSGTQDHGTRGNSYSQASNDYDYNDSLDQITAAQRTQDLRDGMDEYLDGLSPAELEAEADKILTADTRSDLGKEAPSILAAGGENYDKIKFLLATYEELYDKAFGNSFGVSIGDSNLTPQQSEIVKELEEIEEVIHDLVESAEELPTVNEMGHKTMREIRADLARAATLDEDYNEDDFGDYPDSHVRIRNNVR